MTLLRRSLPDTVERSVHVIADGQPLECDSRWLDVLAVVEHGCIDLETVHGARLRLLPGDAFCLALIGPAVIRGWGATGAVVATARRVTVGAP